MTASLVFAAAMALASTQDGAEPADATHPPASDRPVRVTMDIRDAYTSFLAPDTVRRDGDDATVWSLMINKHATIVGTWRLLRFTCSTKTLQLDPAYELNLRLEIVHVGGQPQPQLTISPDTPGDMAYRLACLDDTSVLKDDAPDLKAAFDYAQSH